MENLRVPRSYVEYSKSSPVEVYVAGNRFEIPKDKILKYPGTLLEKMLPELTKEKGGDVNFDRPGDSFKAVQGYYLTGKLHMPLGICPGQFAEELEFWGIRSNLLEPCCLYRLLSFQEHQESTKRFSKTIPSLSSEPLLSGGFSCKQRLWLIIDNRVSSIPAKIYFGFILLFVLLSLASLSLSTMTTFHRKLTICEARDLMFYGSHYDDEIEEYFTNQVDCNEDAEEALRTFLGEYADYTDSKFSEKMEHMKGHRNVSFATTPDFDDDLEEIRFKWKLKKINLPKKTTRLKVFDVIDVIVLVVFSVDLVLRLLTCPSVIAYYKSLLNVIDTLVLVCGIVGYVLEKTMLNFTYETGDLDILVYLQQLRVFRLLRVVQNVAAIQVLSFCFKENFKEIMVLMLFLFVGVNFFANLLYFIEIDNMSSIPKAWWWGLITMTTVGYGDMYPNTGLGKIVGAFCAISGVVVLALIIPIFVNNFLTLYELALLLEKKTKEKPQTKTLQVRPT